MPGFPVPRHRIGPYEIANIQLLFYLLKYKFHMIQINNSVHMIDRKLSES